MNPGTGAPLEVSYLSGEVETRSFVSRPEGDGPFPAVMTIHGIFGLNPPDLGLIQRLASRGYVALAHGWQSRGREPTDDLIMEDIRAGIRYLKENEPVDPALGRRCFLWASRLRGNRFRQARLGHRPRGRHPGAAVGFSRGTRRLLFHRGRAPIPRPAGSGREGA